MWSKCSLSIESEASQVRAHVFGVEMVLHREFVDFLAGGIPLHVCCPVLPSLIWGEVHQFTVSREKDFFFIRKLGNPGHVSTSLKPPIGSVVPVMVLLQGGGLTLEGKQNISSIFLTERDIEILGGADEGAVAD